MKKFEVRNRPCRQTSPFMPLASGKPLTPGPSPRSGARGASIHVPDLRRSQCLKERTLPRQHSALGQRRPIADQHQVPAARSQISCRPETQDPIASPSRCSVPGISWSPGSPVPRRSMSPHRFLGGTTPKFEKCRIPMERIRCSWCRYTHSGRFLRSLAWTMTNE